LKGARRGAGGRKGRVSGKMKVKLVKAGRRKGKGSKCGFEEEED